MNSNVSVWIIRSSTKEDNVSLMRYFYSIEVIIEVSLLLPAIYSTITKRESFYTPYSLTIEFYQRHTLVSECSTLSVSLSYPFFQKIRMCNHILSVSFSQQRHHIYLRVKMLYTSIFYRQCLHNLLIIQLLVTLDKRTKTLPILLDKSIEFALWDIFKYFYFSDIYVVVHSYILGT